MQSGAGKRLAVEVDVDCLRRFDVQPRDARTHRHGIDAQQAPAEQGAQGADGIRRSRHDAQIEQTVINGRLRTEQLTAASLPTVADTKGEEVAFPIETRTAEATSRRMDFRKAGEAGQQIGAATEEALELLGRGGRDLRTEAAGGHVDEWLAIHLANIDRLRRLIQQCQRLERIEGNARSPGKIVGTAERHQRQAGIGVRLEHRLGDLTQRAVTASCDHDRVSGG